MTQPMRQGAKARKLSDAQRLLLIEVCEAGDEGIDVPRRAPTMAVLLAEGLVYSTWMIGGFVLKPTQKGRDLYSTWRCGACGHVEYHCPASGCNHASVDGVWCDCDGYVPNDAERRMANPKGGTK